MQVQKETQNVTGIPGTQMAGGENPAESAGHGSSVVFVEILEVVGDAPQTKVFAREQKKEYLLAYKILAKVVFPSGDEKSAASLLRILEEVPKKEKTSAAHT